LNPIAIGSVSKIKEQNKSDGLRCKLRPTMGYMVAKNPTHHKYVVSVTIFLVTENLYLRRAGFEFICPLSNTPLIVATFYRHFFLSK
jgi:hypothetical protein